MPVSHGALRQFATGFYIGVEETQSAGLGALGFGFDLGRSMSSSGFRAV